jgi:hypothetical protein
MPILKYMGIIIFKRTLPIKISKVLNSLPEMTVANNANFYKQISGERYVRLIRPVLLVISTITAFVKVFPETTSASVITAEIASTPV